MKDKCDETATERAKKSHLASGTLLRMSGESQGAAGLGSLKAELVASIGIARSKMLFSNMAS